MHVVLTQLVLAVAGGEVDHALVAEVEAVEVTRGVFGSLDDGVVGGGGVEVAIPGEDVEVVEFGELGEQIATEAGSEGLEAGVEFPQEAEAAGALKRFEEGPCGWGGGEEMGVLLEEGAPAGDLMEDARDEQTEPGEIGECGAGTGVEGGGEEVVERGEEALGDGGWER